MPERGIKKLHGFLAHLVVADLAWHAASCSRFDCVESAFITKYKLRIDLQPFCP
jgi:hypothetical protein